MFAPAITAIRAKVATANTTGWPLRWSGTPWDVTVDANDNPVNDSGEPIPFIEAEVLGGQAAIVGFSTPGSRLFRHPGLIRLYLVIPARAGDDMVYAAADVFAAALQRTDIPAPAQPQIVRTEDFSVTPGVASVERGGYTVLMAGVGFDFLYLA